MKNTLIVFSMLIPALCHSVAVESAVLASAATATAASIAISQSAQNQQQALLSHVKTSSQIIGVISCSAYYEDVNAPSSYNYTGCKTRGGHLSIKRFFDKFKSHDNYEIIQVIFNDHNCMFNIYYGVK